MKVQIKTKFKEALFMKRSSRKQRLYDLCYMCFRSWDIERLSKDIRWGDEAKILKRGAYMEVMQDALDTVMNNFTESRIFVYEKKRERANEFNIKIEARILNTGASVDKCLDGLTIRYDKLKNLEVKLKLIVAISNDESKEQYHEIYTLSLPVRELISVHGFVDEQVCEMMLRCGKLAMTRFSGFDTAVMLDTSDFSVRVLDTEITSSFREKGGDANVLLAQICKMESDIEKGKIDVYMPHRHRGLYGWHKVVKSDIENGVI